MSTALKLTQTRRSTGGERALSKAGRTARPGQAVRVLRKSVAALTTTLLVLAVAAFLALAIGPRVLGYQTSTMLTGSMSPLINPGDVVVTKPVPAADIKVGDIITYHIPVEDQRVETHRVTEVIANPDGTIAVRTKGDANNGVDPWTATITGSTVDRHALTVPYVGTAIRALREPIVLNIFMYGAPAVLVIGMLASIWGKSPEDKKAVEEFNALA
jgi:signal peptidase I